ncbi:DUF1360 domain-containing protein [Streptomyces scopuliridis]|uniref:DUF1360 domain-containing protein n=1 Tax=Streptomyces scopuliridis TaxID=452529 RepID=A0ACD4ZPE9_9ACTN|nr:DUF1360 domain-containing protein [Streptomyces scopuliridis]WSC00070.1 DUF1360 domain-containing protein [Streptomyces scopuliridis]
MDTLTLVLAALATARITRLINIDRITEAPRNAAIRWLTSVKRKNEERGELLAYMIVCPWCVSMYVGAGMGAAWWAWGGDRWFAAACAALAFSYAAGFLAGREGGE